MRVFVDLDGVLADYYGGIWERFASGVVPPPSMPSPWPYRCRVGDWDFFCGEPLNLSNELVAPAMGHEFYQGLELLPDARAIIEWAVRIAGRVERVYFLSSPWNTPGCDEGKREWVKKYFPGFVKRTLIGSCKEACAGPGVLLLDDSPVNCAKFVAPPDGGPGGYACLVPRPWNSRHAECSHENGAVLDVKNALAHHQWKG